MISLIIFSIGATLIVRSTVNGITKLNLEKYIEIVKYDSQSLTPIEIIDKYQDLDDYLRITFIDGSGSVISDTLTEGPLDNHLNRPEISDLGESYIRHSDTLNIDMMYLATQLDNGNYLRVAIPISSILGFLNDFIALSIVIGVIIVILSITLTSYLIKNSLKPLEDVKYILEEVNNGDYKEIITINKYDEINGLIKKINEINKNISSNIMSLKSEKQKMDFLLNHMDQGICVLDENAKIILLNNYLKDLYRFNINFNINKDYRYLFRDEELQKAIIKVFETKKGETLITNVNGKHYSVSLIFSEKGWSHDYSLILIYTDITSVKNIEILKKDFFVNASHELKSPLTTILGSADLINQGLVKDEETKNDLINRIASEARRMNNLVMDMLTLSEYETKKTDSKKQVINLGKVVDEVIGNLNVFVENKQTKIHIEIENINIFIGYEEIYQVLKNLLENAIKYGKQLGNVWINSNHDEKNLVIRIKDDGIGIPKADINRVFERFYRVDKARSKSSGGTGLGLSIVKHIILSYKGTVELSSVEDEGTEVIIRLPKTEITGL
ncbi:MAG: ATP-binding protein [Candidatus Izemoplasmatales bacterium]|nr:ATP-binding protein [Candidatus Izemoplasmatales bacterium]